MNKPEIEITQDDNGMKTRAPLDTSDELADALSLTEADIVSLLAPYCEARDKATAEKRHQDILGKAIKDYLEKTGEPLYFEGIEARIQERKGLNEYEMERMPDELVLLLHRVGALKVDANVVKVHQGKEVFEWTRQFARPGRVTPALVVEVKR